MLSVALILSLSKDEGVAAVPERTPDQRQDLVQLAYVLGEAHALRQACAGPHDQAWRTRMSRLVEVETPDEAMRRRLVESFNAGFMTRQAEHPNCGTEVAEALDETAARGRLLAERLASDAS